MTTRRIVSTERTLLDKDDPPAPAAPAANSSSKSSIAPAVPTAVIVKLLAFTAAMVVVPISSYYLTSKYVWRGDTILAGATAALMANIVLIVYIVVAVKEDESDNLAEKARLKKGL